MTVAFVHSHAAHCESGVMSSLLRHHGLPISEAMAFGLASAVAFAYLPCIRINGLLLGPTLSKRMPTEQTAELTRRAPLGQLHSPDDVAAAALFLASDESRMVTGAFLPLDAGRSMPSSM